MRIPEYPKSEVEFEQEKESFYPARWWQATDKSGLLAETSSRSDFEQLGLLDQEGVTFRRLYEKKEMRWVEEHPFPPNVEWRSHPEFILYEMNKHGVVRDIASRIQLSPTLIGDEGYVGFLLKKGISVYLKPIHELYSELFPELMKDKNNA